MLNVYICEDDKKQLADLSAIVSSTIMIEEYDMTLELSTVDPYELLNEIQDKKNFIGVYILDVDLNTDIDGIELAAKIRQYDVSGTIIFVTTHLSLIHI